MRNVITKQLTIRALDLRESWLQFFRSAITIFDESSRSFIREIYSDDRSHTECQQRRYDLEVTREDALP